MPICELDLIHEGSKWKDEKLSKEIDRLGITLAAKTLFQQINENYFIFDN